ncbi:DUF4406 domain-containing protein [uncultured Bacteroides sp.]|uniref:DUF4406 domain-containing protein n=1 Tax=uncultured Bacteroides sp. TaxID=162156 RepID=UPI002AAAAB3C|nr:DUF4406 domain-containing protein [uncultured Bacteroides sp.]
MSEPRRIYISTPITGLPLEEIDKNIKRAKLAIIAKGDIPVSPLEITKDSPHNATIGHYMGKDIEHLIDNCEGAYFTRKWKESKGCNVEYITAKVYEKEIQFE